MGRGIAGTLPGRYRNIARARASREEARRKLENFPRSKRHVCGGNWAVEKHRAGWPRQSRKDPTGRSDAFHRRRDNPARTSGRRDARYWTSSPKNSITRPRSIPPFIISTGKRPKSFSAILPATAPSSSMRSTRCRPSTRLCSWSARAATLRSNPKKYGNRPRRSACRDLAFVSRLDRERTSFRTRAGRPREGAGGASGRAHFADWRRARFQWRGRRTRMKALTYADNTTGKPKEEDLAGELKTRAEEARTKLCEAVAETDDALLEKYLDKGELSEDELRVALRAAVIAGKLTPVLCGSGAKNIGIGSAARRDHQLCSRRPTSVPRDKEPTHPMVSESNARGRSQRAVFSLRVQDRDRSLRRQADHFSASSQARAHSDAGVYNSARESKERFGQLLRLEGKKQAPLALALPGEIAAVAKLKDTSTGDTLCDEKAPILSGRLIARTRSSPSRFDPSPRPTKKKPRRRCRSWSMRTSHWRRIAIPIPAKSSSAAPASCISRSRSKNSSANLTSKSS